MDHNQHRQQTRVTSTTEQSYGTNLYDQYNHITAPIQPPTGGVGLYDSSSFYEREPQYAQPYIQQLPQQALQQQELQQQLSNFWAKQYHEIVTSDFRSHTLPLARIKRIMKANEDVSMISAEAPIFFAKACEMFISELTMKAWANTDENKRRTLHKNDIAIAIARTEVFDFLVDVVPKDDKMDNEVHAGISREGKAPIENVPYYSPPPQQVTSTPYNASRVVMGRLIPDSVHYGQQAHSSGAQMWSNQENHFPNSEN